MEGRIESLLLGARWLLLPLYALLLATVIALYVTVGRDILHLFATVAEADDIEVLIVVLSALDLVLVANLVLMVAVSSFESFIARIAIEADRNRPEWLGKLDSGNIKVKVAISVVMISAIHLLRAYMRDSAGEQLFALAGVHLVFVASALLLALTDRISRAKARPLTGPPYPGTG